MLEMLWSFLVSLFNAWFGCAHKHTTFPLTPARKAATASSPSARLGTYVVCLDCGQEFRYNWKEMRMEEPVPVRATAAVPSAATTETFSPARR
jgi:hypothetical protein